MLVPPEDVWWFARTTTAEVVVTVAATDTPFVPYDRSRVALMIAPPGSSTINLSWGGKATLNQGAQLTSASAPLLLTIVQHGVMVHGPIRAIGALGGIVCTYIETCAPIT